MAPRDASGVLKPDRALLWSGLLLAVGLLVFFGLAALAAAGRLEVFDRELILALRPAGVKPGAGGQLQVVQDVTALGGTTLIVFATALGVLGFAFQRKPRHALLLLGAVLMARLSCNVAKSVFARPRPEILSHEAFVQSASFPSGHATLATATYLTIAMLAASLVSRQPTRRLFHTAALLVAAGVGVSRVYLGVHYPSDVLAGWVLGAMWTLGAWVALRATSPRQS